VTAVSRAVRLAASILVMTAAALTAPPAQRAEALPGPAPCDGCWVPALETSWQWQLQGTIDTSVDASMFDVDLFDTPRDTIAELHDAGRHVVCYVSAGSWERWRRDAGRFPERILGRPNGWPGERWLDIRRVRALAPIMTARMDRCVDKGFDAVEFDNVDGYSNRSGFALRASDQARYNMWLANQAHRRGLSVALKNDLEQVRKLLPYFDFALDEECHVYDECDLLRRSSTRARRCSVSSTGWTRTTSVPTRTLGTSTSWRRSSRCGPGASRVADAPIGSAPSEFERRS
jgi:hypothetical protein